MEAFAQEIGVHSSEVLEFEGDCSYKTFLVASGEKRGYYWMSSQFYKKKCFYPSELIKLHHMTFRHPGIAKPIWINYDSTLGLVFKFPVYRFLSETFLNPDLSKRLPEQAKAVRKNRKLITDSKFLAIFNQLIRVCRFIHSHGYFGIVFDPNYLAFKPKIGRKNRNKNEIVLLNLDCMGTQVNPESKIEPKKQIDINRFIPDAGSLLACMNKILDWKHTSLTPGFRSDMREVITDLGDRKCYLNQIKKRLITFNTGPTSVKKTDDYLDRKSYILSFLNPKPEQDWEIMRQINDINYRIYTGQKVSTSDTTEMTDNLRKYASPYSLK